MLRHKEKMNAMEDQETKQKYLEMELQKLERLRQKLIEKEKRAERRF